VILYSLSMAMIKLYRHLALMPTTSQKINGTKKR
jgi:hypothetical protein